MAQKGKIDMQVQQQLLVGSQRVLLINVVVADKQDQKIDESWYLNHGILT